MPKVKSQYDLYKQLPRKYLQLKVLEMINQIYKDEHRKNVTSYIEYLEKWWESLYVPQYIKLVRPLRDLPLGVYKNKVYNRKIYPEDYIYFMKNDLKRPYFFFNSRRPLGY